MSVLKNIWKDITKFQNIDSYLTIIVAIGVTILNLYGLSNTNIISSLTLTVLGLLAFTSLRNRHQIDELTDSMNCSTKSFFIKEFPPDLHSNFNEASEIWLMGVSLQRTVTLNYEIIKRKLNEGNKFKVIVVHPEGPGIEMAMSRNYPRKDIEPKSTSIQNTLRILCDLQKDAPDHIEIRTIQNPLSYGAVVTDPSKSSGALYLEHYTFGISTDSLPRFVIRSSDGYWYDFMKKEILSMWDAGQVWKCDVDDLETAS